MIRFRKCYIISQVACCVAVQIALACLSAPACAQDPDNRVSSGVATRIAIGRTLYNSNCAGCHGLDGKGGEHGPNITSKRDTQSLRDPDIKRVVREGIAAAGMPAFGSRFDADEMGAVLDYLRFLQGRHEQIPANGDVSKGEQLFFGKRRCSQCHMVAGKGGFLGADLSAYGASHSAAAIREAILDPNKDLDPQNGMVIVVTRDNHTYSGLRRNEDNFSLQLQTPDGVFHSFDKSSLSRIEYKGQSIMPADYGTKLTRTDLDDLVAYLLASSSREIANHPDKPADH